MQCPNCEIGFIVPVLLKRNGEKAFVCEYCETIWLSNEEIKSHTGHDYEGIKQGSGYEYFVEESEDKDQEHRSAQFPKYK